MFQPIDQVKTGIKLKKMLKAAGYDVRDIQEYLHLSCPQSSIAKTMEIVQAGRLISYIKRFSEAS